MSRIWFVTGASSGIGAGIVEAVLKPGGLPVGWPDQPR